MSIRTDITIHKSSSPRIIEIAAPSTSLILQDLYDTVRHLAEQPDQIDEPEYIEGSGKEVLSLNPNVSVGLTIKLLNARVKFEDRGGESTPIWISCDIYGGNLVAVDENGVKTDPVEPSSYVTITRTLSSSATISGAVITEQDKLEIADRVLDEAIGAHQSTGSLGKEISDTKKQTRTNAGLILAK